MIEPHTPPVVNIDAMALATAKQIASVNPNLPGGAVQALATIQGLVRTAMEQYRPYDHLSRVQRHLQDAQAVATRELERANYLADQAGKLEKRCAELDHSNNQRQRAIENKDRELQRAIRALEGNGFKDMGGREWVPPVNTVAGELRQRVIELEGRLRDQIGLTASFVEDLAKAPKPAMVSDLVLLTTRLSRQLIKAAPDSELPHKAAAFLRKHDLIGSPLRTEGEPDDLGDDTSPGEVQDADQAQQDAMARTGVVDPNAWMRGDQWTADELEKIQGDQAETMTLYPDHMEIGRGVLRKVGGEDPVIVTVGNEATESPDVVTIPYEGPERRAVKIPGAVWPTPGQTGFNLDDKLDPFCAQLRHLPFKGRRHDDD